MNEVVDVDSARPVNLGDMIMKLQGLLMEISGSNMVVTTAFLIEHFGDDEIRASIASQTIVFAVRYQSSRVAIYAKLVKSALKCNSFQMVFLQSALIKECSKMWKRIMNAEEQIQSGRALCKFVYLLLKEGVFFKEDIETLVSGLLDKWPSKNRFPFALFAWLGPEVEHLLPIDNILSCFDDTISSRVRDMWNDNWKKVIEARDRDGPFDVVVDAIAADDVDKWREVSGRRGIDVAYAVPLNEYDTIFVDELAMPITLIAARLRSHKCFKYFLMNGVSVDRVELAAHAVVGGSTEMVRLAEQYGCEFSSALGLSVVHHQYYVFDWLCGQNLSSVTESIIFDALLSGNVHVLDFLACNDVSLSEVDEAKMTLLHYAVTLDVIVSAAFLLDRGLIDANARDAKLVCFMFT